MRPFMTDPATVASLEGQQYLVLRPVADVAAFYKEEQRNALDRLPSGLPHPNTGHVTLRGFAEPERVDALLDTVRAWASSTRPIEVGVEAIDGFAPPFKVLLARLKRSQSLTSAYASLTQVLDATGVERIGELPLEEWIFHLSLVYCAGLSDAEWDGVVQASRRPVSPGPTEWIDTAELVWYDGGREHVAVVPLGGGTDRAL